MAYDRRLVGKKPAELTPAWQWTCHRCGCSQFVRREVWHLDPDDDGDILLMQKIAGVVSEDGIMVVDPEYVRCKQCGDNFEATYPDAK